jgi:hypothetical protein
MNAFQLSDYFVSLNREAIACKDPERLAYLTDQITAIARLLNACRPCRLHPPVSADIRRGPLALAIFGMRVDEVFPSRFLKAADLAGKPVLVTIKAVNVQEFDADENDKLLLTFQEAVKPFIANKTNALVLAGFLGDETDQWAGHRIVLFQTEVNFGGRLVPAIRCRAPKVKQPPPTLPPPPAVAAGEEDDVPF